MARKKKERKRHAGILDIECAHWDRFVCGELYDARTGERAVSWDADTLASDLAGRSGIWYAHAGGKYDALWFLDWCVRHGYPWEARLRGAGLLSVKLGELELRDSYALVPLSLAKAAPMGGFDKMELALSCECGADCGGYCVLERPLTRREKRQVESYLHRDCEALSAVLDAVHDFAESESIDLRLTIGSSAWATAKGWLDLPAAEWSKSQDFALYEATREGYYGGRTEVFRARAKAGERYDIHSSYPAALSRVKLPSGAATVLRGAEASRHFGAGRPCIVTADVDVSRETWTPPLPFRVPDRLLYPVGRFAGTWTSVELAAAMAAGVRVRRVTGAVAWTDATDSLAAYAERVWSLRAREAARDTAKGAAFAAWLKWLANSLTGKLGQNVDHSTLFFASADDGLPAMPETAEIVRTTQDGIFYSVPSRRIDSCAHVHWAAWLTSDARAELGAQLRHAERNAIYCDTDSVYATRPLTRRIGDDLGEWGHEGSLRDWRALAPKVYAYTDQSGRRVVKGKGMSGLTSEGFDGLAEGEKWTTDRGAQGVKTRLRKKEDDWSLFARQKLTRGLKPVPGWIGGRALDSRTGLTRPVTVEEYNERD